MPCPQLDVPPAPGELQVRHIVRHTEAQRHLVSHHVVELDGFHPGIRVPPLLPVRVGERVLFLIGAAATT